MTASMEIDLQRIFQDKVVTYKQFADIHPGQASYVWLVQTAEGRQILRTTRLADVPANEFWYGCKRLFGVIPDNVHAMKKINNTLRETSLLPIPEILSTPTVDGIPFVVVEELSGTTIHSFQDLPVRTLEELGRGIASIHLQHGHSFGDFTCTLVQPVSGFWTAASCVCEDVVQRFYQGKPEFVSALSHFQSMFGSMEPPSHAVPILLDMDPTQFLTDGIQITGLIDTEVYAWGPPEWDLVALEYLLDNERALAFQRGYESISRMPVLAGVRQSYRFMQRLMELQGAVPLERWMNQPVWFD